jgi:hypothetical protein
LGGGSGDGEEKSEKRRAEKETTHGASRGSRKVEQRVCFQGRP